MCTELLPSKRKYANTLYASMYVRRLVSQIQPSNSVATAQLYYRCGDDCQVAPGGGGEALLTVSQATQADSDGHYVRPGLPELLPQQRLYQERRGSIVRMPEGYRVQTADDYRQGLTTAGSITERSHCAKHAGLVADWSARLTQYLVI